MSLANLFAVVVLGVALTGCSLPTIKQPIDPSIFYKRDFGLTVNGKTGTGVIVVPKAAQYVINGVSLGSLNLLSIRSCHREFAAENLSDQKFSYTYIPQTSMELLDTCILDIAGFDSDKGQHSWGLIAFEDTNGVAASSKCNGTVVSGKTTACQAPAGLVQEVIFQEEMLASPSVGACSFPDLNTKRGKNFQYTMPRGNCVLIFGRVADGAQTFHRHYTIGYQQIMLRDN